MSDRGIAAIRAAHAATHVLGGCRVTLRMPAPASGTDASQLGLEDATYSEITLAPVLIRPVNATETVLFVSADVLNNALGLTKAQDIQTALATSAGIAIQGAWWLLQSTEALEVFGEPYLYQIRITAAQGEA